MWNKEDAPIIFLFILLTVAVVMVGLVMIADKAFT
jgi:hypothetical protein